MKNTIQKLFIVLFAVAVLFVAFHAHCTAGFGLPPPWEDEGQFLWPSLSVAQHGTLFTEHLNPDRPIFLMLMGYSVLMGLCFKILPFSLMAGRMFSFTWMMLAVFVFGFMVRRWRSRWLIWIFVGLVAISRPFIVAGNIVRPEAFCLLLVFAAMSTSNRRPWLSLAVLGILPLMHPNGVLFVFAGCVCALLTWPHMVGGFQRSDWVALGFVGFCWVLMGLFVARYMDGFLQDITYSLFAYPKPMMNKIRCLVLNGEISPFLFAAIGLAYYWRKTDPARCWAGLLAAMLLVVPALRIQMWYAVYTAAGQLVSLSLLMNWVAERKGLSSVWKTAFFLFVAGTGIWGLYRTGAIEGPRGYPQDMSWGWGMRTEDPIVRYFTEEDRKALANELIPYASANAPIRVTFLPQADALFFSDYDRENIIGYQPLSTDIFPDIVIYRESRYLPKWIQDYYAKQLQEYAGDSPVNPIRVRNATERWSLIFCNPVHVSRQNPS